MSIYVKVNNTEYPATVDGVNNDRTWNGRDTKTVTLTMTHDVAAALLPDNTPWSIVQRDMVDVLDEQGQPTGETTTYLEDFVYAFADGGLLGIEPVGSVENVSGTLMLAENDKVLDILLGGAAE